MAFTAHSGMLKFGFILSTILFFLGAITLGSMAKYSKSLDTQACILFYNNGSNSPSICTFATVAGGVITIGGILLFAFDLVTWKRSENYKGRKASVTTLILAPAMCIFSFCAAIVIGLGIKTTCSNIEHCSDDNHIIGTNGVYTGISCSALAGLLFAIYAASEWVQYRRRHVDGDKW